MPYAFPTLYKVELKEMQETLKLVQDHKTASKYLINCFLHLEEKLEQTFPESDLSMTTE